MSFKSHFPNGFVVAYAFFKGILHDIAKVLKPSPGGIFPSFTSKLLLSKNALLHFGLKGFKSRSNFFIYLKSVRSEHTTPKVFFVPIQSDYSQLNLRSKDRMQFAGMNGFSTTAPKSGVDCSKRQVNADTFPPGGGKLKASSNKNQK